MKLRASLIAYTSIALALGAWAAVAFFALSIQEVSQKSIDLAASAQVASEQQTTAFQTHEFAKAVAPVRTQFEHILKSDPLSLSSILTQAGKDAGVVVQIDSASPESAPASSGAHVAAVSFALQATGSFAALMRLVALLEVLPVPSKVEGFDVSVPTDPLGHASLWHMNVRVRLLTSSQISS